MLSPTIETALNAQIKVEAESSQIYLSMASWAEVLGFEGVAQFIFLKGNETPETTYADRNGKYMRQTGVTLPKV